MNWLRDFLLPRQGSTNSADVDSLFLFIILLTVFFFFFNGGLILYAVRRWRRRSPDEVTPHITHNTRLEILWSAVPAVVVMAIFFWGFKGYVRSAVPPNEAMEIIVTARKWNWTFEYPDGTRSLNDLHVPLGKPIKLVMHSEDVIHSFFVPDFRRKMDVLPNRYTEYWFNATLPGKHTLFCAEYCGKGHSDMLGAIWVDTPEQYEKFLREGDEQTRSMPLAELGRLVYENKGCATCHSLDGSRGQGPSFKGIWNKQELATDNKTHLVDANYVRESLLAPQAVIVQGFEPVMPTFQGLLREREILAIIEFIKAQK